MPASRGLAAQVGGPQARPALRGGGPLAWCFSACLCCSGGGLVFGGVLNVGRGL